MYADDAKKRILKVVFHKEPEVNVQNMSRHEFQRRDPFFRPIYTHQDIL